MSEMGLVHFPGPDQPNPNPVCSDIALQLADAVASELGDIAGRFFKVVEAGTIAASELGSFAEMKPTNLQPGSLEREEERREGKERVRKGRTRWGPCTNNKKKRK